MISYKSLGFIFALLCISQAHSGCTHDQQEKTEPEFLDVDEDFSSIQEGGRVLAAESSYPKMRIYPHYDLLSSAPSSYASYLENDLVPPVIAYFESALRVKYPVVGKLKLAASVKSICLNQIPSILYNPGVDADFFIFFITRSENSFNIALSQYCYLASGSKRPLVAYTNINRNMLMEAKGDPHLHEKNTYLLMHELLHNFGFTTYAYPYFIDENGKALKGHVKSVKFGGKTRTVLDLPPLTSRLRKFFGCSSIPGGLLENDGGDATASSHFERRFFLYDLMTSGLINGHRISEFSLALLEGSGWYAPDYSYAEPYFWGQGQGCAFLTGSCTSSSFNFNDEFCKGESMGCGAMGRAGGRCSVDKLSDGCRFYKAYEDNDCENPDGYDNARLPDLQVFGRGAGSKCFTGTLNTRQSNNGRTTFCFKYKCINGGNNVEVQVGEKKVVCDKEGQRTIDGFYGAIDCPDPTTFCNTVAKPYCPRNCMGRGTCVDNKCKCNKGFTGIDCGLRI